jgi:hypothetical protein
MPTVAFSTMNAASVPNLQLAFAGSANFTHYQFSVLTNTLMRGATAGIPSSLPPTAVRQLLANVQDLWNLDRSEAARRVYIDAWLTSAMVAARNGTSVITPEENIAINNPINAGHGRIDYLICEMVPGLGPAAPGNVVPEYAPSVIVESKRDLSVAQFDGIGQLVAEIDTLRRLKVYNNPLRGIVTDGRHWRFIEMLDANNNINMTPPYDSGTPAGWAAQNYGDLQLVWGRICQFLAQMRNKNSIMT